MKVTLLTTNEQLKAQEKIALKAVSQCYQSTTLKADKLPYLSIIKGHRTILEFFDLTFLIEGISYRSHVHLIRHRHTTPMVQSQRYTSSDWIVNPFEDKESYAEFEEAVDSFQKQLEILSVDLHWKNENTAYAKPQGVKINMCLKLNLRSFVELVEKRTASNVMPETRECVKKMLKKASKKKVLRKYLTAHVVYRFAYKQMTQNLEEEWNG